MDGICTGTKLQTYHISAWFDVGYYWYTRWPCFSVPDLSLPYLTYGEGVLPPSAEASNAGLVITKDYAFESRHWLLCTQVSSASRSVNEYWPR